MLGVQPGQSSPFPHVRWLRANLRQVSVLQHSSAHLASLLQTVVMLLLTSHMLCSPQLLQALHHGAASDQPQRQAEEEAAAPPGRWREQWA